MSDIPQIPIIIIRDDGTMIHSPPSFHKPYLAYVITNPDLRADGRTEEDAICNLKLLLLCQIPSKFIRMTNIVLDDLVVEEVHDS